MKKHKNGPPPKGMIGPRVDYLSRLVKKCFNEAVAQQGLFSGQQDILFALVENEGITQSRLASRMNVAPATISVSVKRMEKNGFIVKKQDELDARIIRLYPTEKARLAPERIREHMEALEKNICSGMTEEQTRQLSDLLDLAISNLKKGSEHND